MSQRKAEAAIFLKPPSSMVSISDHVSLSGYPDVICETELAFLVTRKLQKSLEPKSDDEIRAAVGWFAIALDFTRTDIQTDLKGKGKPWDLARGFDGACPISSFVTIEKYPQILTGPDIPIRLTLNGVEMLNQPMSDMMSSPNDLIRLINETFSLWPGDVILTGTPTKPHLPPRLKAGDKVTASIGALIGVQTTFVNSLVSKL